MNPDEFVLLNQSGPIIIGQGELSEFDASAIWAKYPGLPICIINTANGLPYVAIRSFYNEGNDFGSWGRPSWLPLLMDGSSFSLSCLYSPKILSNAGSMIGLESADGRPFSISYNGYNGSQYRIWCGGSVINSSKTPILGWEKATLKRIGATATISDSNYTQSFTCGIQSNLVNPVIISAGTFEGSVGLVEVKDGSGIILDKFNANDPKQWNGGATATSSAGNAIAFTDGAPLGRTAFSFMKLSDCISWGLF